MALKRVVLDTNVYISGIVFGGRPAHLLQLAEGSYFHLLTSNAIRQEVERVLSAKFRWTPATISATCLPFWQASQLVESTFEIRDCVDPDDNRILECALAGHADFIVSGDRHLLDMKSFRGIGILAIHGFLAEQ
jgi:uncharacterized protein